MILSERNEGDLRPLTQYPNPKSRLPSDLNPSQSLDNERLQRFGTTKSASLSSLHLSDISQFGKQAQAVSLLDRILRITRFATNNSRNTLLKLTELAELDSKIRSLLMTIMEEGDRSPTSQPAIPIAVALCFR
jgi:hypothetical protein